MIRKTKNIVVAFLLLLPPLAFSQTFTLIDSGAIVNDGGSSFSAAWGDYNNDGYLDLFVSNAGDNPVWEQEINFLYRNNGDGTFDKVMENLINNDVDVSIGTSWADYDNDGDLDLFVANADNDNNILYRNDLSPEFHKITNGTIVTDGEISIFGSWADYDNDGDLDLFVTNPHNNNFLYENYGNSTFNKITEGEIVNDGGWSFGASWADYDDDGDLDLFVANGAFSDPENNFLYQNNGDGTFIKVESAIIVNDPNPGSSSNGSWGDYDNDGDLDLFVANRNQNNCLYRNDRTAGFYKITTGDIVNDRGFSRTASWGDYDNDGDLDLFVANEGGINFMYRNNGDETFTSVTSGDIISYALGGSCGMSWGDYDRDGHLDLFVGNLLDNNFLLHNDGNENSWINIHCRGTVSNSSAIGTRISVFATINGISQWQMREISGGELSQNSLNAEFGLGNATIIDTIRIRWPGGAIQDLTQVQVNQFLSIVEPQFERITTGDIVNNIGRSFGSSWGDYDNDGDPDLFVANATGEKNQLYRNEGDGIFELVPNGTIISDAGNSQSATWGDYNNDGYLDLFVTNAGSQNNNNVLYQNNGNETFIAIPNGEIVNDGGNSKGCSWGDYNNDGHLDLFVANDHGKNFLYKNNGDGTFLKIEDGNIVNDVGDSFGASWVDYDNDGDVDLFVANIGDNFLYENNGDGTFSRIFSGEIVTSQGSQGSSWADFDNDGDLDVLLTGLSEFALYRNEGRSPQSGQVKFDKYSSETKGLYTGSSWADPDNDGDLDLIVARSGENSFWENNGSGEFTSIFVDRIATDGGNSTGTAWADFNGNGLADLFVSNNNENNFLYKTVGIGNHWLNIRLEGRASNASAIGAKVSVSALINGFMVTQLREISGQTGYLSQNNIYTSFGLKDAEVADSVRIEWPSGAINKYSNIEKNPFLVFEENNRPRVERTIPLITLTGQNTDFVDNIAEPPVFFDADGDAMTFQAIASDSNIAAATLLGSQLTVSLRDLRAAGKATVTLTADDSRVDDSRGETERLVFEINRPPLLLRAISTKIFAPGNTTPFVEDLATVFLDPDAGSNLIYRVTNPDSSIAILSVDDRILTISRGDSSGQVTITLVADDVLGGISTTGFIIRNVSSNTAPRLITNSLPNQTLVLSGKPFRLNLKTLFTDDDDDLLSFSASGSSPSVALTGILEDTVLIVEPLMLGETVITVRANDGVGGEVSPEFKVEVLLSIRPKVDLTPVIQPQNLGQTISIEAAVTDDEGNDALEPIYLQYRIAGSANFDSTMMDISSIDDTTIYVNGLIPASAVTNRGVEYFIAVHDTHGVMSIGPASRINSIQVHVGGQGVTKESPQPGGNEQTGYRIISIPLELDDKNPQSVLADDLGSYDPAQWRWYQWIALESGGVAKIELPDISAPKILPGEAFWLIVKNPGIFIDSGPGKTITTSTRDSIRLQSGWNLIGNPFNFPTFAEDMLSDGTAFSLRSYDHNGWSDVLDPNTTELLPFEGYAVKSSSVSYMFIKPNPSESGNVLQKQIAMKDNKNVWKINIQAKIQNARDNFNIASVTPSASKEWDRLDHPEPPGIGEYVSVYFPHPEWDRHSRRYSTDIRSELQDGDEWDIDIVTNIRDVVTLTFKGIESVPAENEVWVIDKTLKMTINIQQRENHMLVGGTENNPKRLTLLVGKQSYVDEKLQEFKIAPIRYELSQNFPNPFNPATTIRYSLPYSNRVTLRVFNILGQEIVTLVNNEQKEAGYHVAIWNAHNAAGNVVTSGVYLFQLQAGDFFQVKKMILLR